jgi:hypothetical protein
MFLLRVRGSPVCSEPPWCSTSIEFGNTHSLSQPIPNLQLGGELEKQTGEGRSLQSTYLGSEVRLPWRGPRH